MKRLFFFFFFVSAMFSLPILMKKLTYGFRTSKLQLEFPNDPQWNVEASPEVFAILDQPYLFLGKGAQCYAFESRDRAYVIKLFRFNKSHKEQKITKFFTACKVAYDHLKEETGLIFVHLNTGGERLPILKCKDALGRTYRLKLENYRFALQRKAEPFRDVLARASKDPVEMQKRIDQFLDLLKKRSELNILNTDPTLSRNFGFLADRAIEFDFGNYRQASEIDRKGEIAHYAGRLRYWLSKNYPEWVDYLDQRIQSL